jgi:hypothetical protein
VAATLMKVASARTMPALAAPRCCTSPAARPTPQARAAHPFVLEHDGQLYLVPESAKNRTAPAHLSRST